MKMIIKSLLILSIILNIYSLGLKKQIVSTYAPNKDITVTEIQRTPIVHVSQYFGSQNLRRNSESMDAYASNTNTAPNLGAFGKTPEYVYPHVDFVSNRPIYTQVENRAVLGERTEDTKITSVNKVTGKMEQHLIEKKTPILGKVTQTVPLIQQDRVSYDIKTNHITQEDSKIIGV